MSGNRAPSVDCYYQDHDVGQIIVNDVYVPSTGSTPHTYYCCLTWNTGKEGGGYLGIQHSPTGHNLIFSLWDPKATKQPITTSYLGHGTKSSRFGGEGTGLHTDNFSYGWRENQWYTVVMRVSYAHGHTYFGFWVHDQYNRKWFHMATLNYPVANVQLQPGTGCFIEDWAGNDGQNARSVYYKNAYKMTTSGHWVSMNQMSYLINQEAATSQHNNNYDVKVYNNVFYLSTGDSIHPTSGTTGNLRISQNSQPSIPAMQFSITSASTRHVSWSIPESSVPQFSYVVKMDGHVVAAGDSSEVRSVNFNRSGHTVTVTLEDILRRTTTHTRTV